MFHRRRSHTTRNQYRFEQINVVNSYNYKKISLVKFESIELSKYIIIIFFLSFRGVSWIVCASGGGGGLRAVWEAVCQSGEEELSLPVAGRYQRAK